MSILKKLSVATAGASFIALAAGGTAQAQTTTFAEFFDAGETIGTANVVNTQPTGTPLTTIIGGLSTPNDADLFRIFLPGGQTFSATTVGGATFNTQLFLFNANGFGVEANDNSASTVQSTLPAGGLSPAASGIYYLGISSFDNDPVSSGGLIFPDISTGVQGPTGPGGGSPLSGFNRSGSQSGPYTISLTGAQFSNATPVPVPEFSSVLSFLILGAWGAMAHLIKGQK